MREEVKRCSDSLPSEGSGRWFDPSRARQPLRQVAAAAAAAAAALLASGCGSPPAAPPERPDGAPAAVPRDLERVPDAVPRVEPIRSGAPNRPYSIDGRDYVPITDDRPHAERGLASWYGARFHGRPTAAGERYDMYAMTAAHPTLPLPSYARIRNPANGREVVVRVNDRGPFVRGRIVDLSYAAALRLGLLRGPGIVELRRLTNAEIAAAQSQQ